MLLTAERVLVNGQPQAHIGVVIGGDGRIAAVRSLEPTDVPDRTLGGQLLVPGFVNAQAQVWSRLASLVLAHPTNSEARAVGERLVWQRLDPAALYHTARLAFSEMLVSGVTTVAVMHALHCQTDGTPYDDSSEMADAVMRAAREAGIRLSLLRGMRVGAHASGGLNELHQRSADHSPEAGADNLLRMAQRLLSFADARLSWGVGVQSVDAVDLHSLVALKTRFAHAPFHLPASGADPELKQLGVSGRYGAIEGFAAANLLDSCTVLCGSEALTHRGRDWAALLGAASCLVPDGEAELHSDRELPRQSQVCVGSGSRRSVRCVAQTLGRALRPEDELLAAGAPSNMGNALFTALTENGCRALQIDAGSIEPGRWADLQSFDLQHPSLVGVRDAGLVAQLMLNGADLPPREVMVAGRWVVQDGVHPGLVEAQAEAERAAAAIVSN